MVISPEQIVDDDGGKIKQHARYAVWVEFFMLPCHDAIENNTGVGATWGLHCRWLHCSRIRSICSS